MEAFQHTGVLSFKSKLLYYWEGFSLGYSHPVADTWYCTTQAAMRAKGSEALQGVVYTGKTCLPSTVNIQRHDCRVSKTKQKTPARLTGPYAKTCIRPDIKQN